MNESQEQIMFVEWLRQKNIPHSSIPSSFFSADKGGRKFGMINKLKREGWAKGVPDMFCCVPCWDGKNRVVFIEMKQSKVMGKRGKLVGGGKASKEQVEWIDTFKSCEEVDAVVAFGAGEAIAFVEGLMK